LFLKSPPGLILASTSAYRRQLLARLRLPFTCTAPGVEETPRGAERALDLAVRLARAKALSVALQHPDAWVVGSDQVAVLGEGPHERTLGKPGTEARCIEQLRASSGQTVAFLTAVALVRHEGRSSLEFLDTTRVTFRALDEDTIARYVAAESPLDCAGAFKSEGLGITLCESIETQDPSALIGLPLIRLSQLLRDVGFAVP
jgi:septum formation protein